MRFSRSRGVGRARSSTRARAAPIDGVIAVGDRPVVLAARAAEALGLPWHSRGGRAPPAPTSAARAPPSRPPASRRRGSRSTLASPTSARDSASRAMLGFPCVLKPRRAVGQPRRDPRRHAAGIRRRVRAHPRAARAAARFAPRATGLEDEILVEEYIDGREFAIEGRADRRRAARLRDLRQARSARGAVLRGDDLRDAVARSTRAQEQRRSSIRSRGRAALGLAHGPIHAECRVADGEVLRARSRGAADRRPVLARAAVSGSRGAGRRRSLEERAAAARGRRGRSTDVRASARAAAVMMIPIPRAGCSRGGRGGRRARGAAGSTDVAITAKTDQLLEPLPEAGSYLGFIFARAATRSRTRRRR